MPPAETNSASAHEWLKRARSNLAMAQPPEPGRPEQILWEDLCYMAQQAAEKALKAVYQYNNLRFRYVHDLEELGKGLEDAGLSIPEVIKNAVILTRYASALRYPGPDEPVTEEEYKTAVDLARSVVEWAEGHIASTE